MYTFPFYFSFFTLTALAGMFAYIVTRKEKKQMHYIFILIVLQLFVWHFAVIMQTLFHQTEQAYIFWENASYLGSAGASVSMLLLAMSYGGASEWLQKRAILLMIVPVITQVMIWTNDYHRLFYQQYSLDGMHIPGAYFYFHAGYSYLCLLAAIIYLCYFAIINGGIFSVQALLILIGSIFPAVTNICYTMDVKGFNVYSTPMAFAITTFMYALGMFRFNLLTITPITLQTIINRISDSFIVVDANMNIVDFNAATVRNFPYWANIRTGENLFEAMKNAGQTRMDFERIRVAIEKALQTNTEVIDEVRYDFNEGMQCYTVEYTPISNKRKSTAVIILFKDITQHIKDMEEIKKNQDMLLERERLASLGQLIGGIAHNMKTPIMSVSGGIDQLQELVDEYDSSVLDPQVTQEDHHEIAAEMKEWLSRMKMHMGYMSDIISAVKDQASKFGGGERAFFTMDELLKRVKILMQHELVKNRCTFEERIHIPLTARIQGNINSLVQILDNIIVNAIHAYEGHPGEIVFAVMIENKKIVINIIDYGMGIAEHIKDRMFKEMITTKGKHGTGLGLYMSYSTIKGMFGGDMWFASEPGEGTMFVIELPLQDALDEGEENNASETAEVITRIPDYAH